MSRGRFLQNALTALRHPGIGLDFVTWRGSQWLGRPRLVHGAFGTRLRTSSFADFQSTREFVPEGAEMAMLKGLASHTPVFLDVGANFGVWTLALAAAFPKAQVHAFEPTPSTYSILLENIRANRVANVKAHQLALSDAVGVCAFQMSDKQSIFNRLVPARETVQDWRKHRFDESHVTDVESLTLDAFCERQHIDRVGFMKLDVEGNDLNVLRGAGTLLRRQAIETIWMEVEPDNLHEMGDSLEQLAAFVDDVDYAFHPLESSGRPGPPVDIRHSRTLNMLVLPRSR